MFVPATLRSLRRLWGVRLRDIPVVANARLRRPARYVVKLKRVEVRPDCLTSPGLRDVLIHELAHAASVELHGPAVRPHGREWRELIERARRARLLDGGGPALVPRERRQARRYRHSCPVCHFARRAKRAVSTWRCCPFCHPDVERVAFLHDQAFGLWDGFPVSPGHILVIPKRHMATWFDATKEEQQAITEALDEGKRQVEKKHHPDGYNIGVNVGKAAGQTVDHLHVHLIPRYAGDVKNPRGGSATSSPARATTWPRNPWAPRPAPVQG
jgi:diadenosine tetraphosphate (Ap4A) HIT family hydrolase